MADSVSQDRTHQEGTDHIKSTLADKEMGGSAQEDVSAVDFRNNYVNPAGSTSTGTHDSTMGQSNTMESKNADTSAPVAGSTGAGSTFDTPARSGTEGESTSGAGDTFDSEAKGMPQAEKAVEKNKEEKEDTSGEKKPKSSADPKTMENRESIPTAGGEKLGEKHWGESKIVAENPKPSETGEAGVSSKDGQPTSETADNTAKNTGGASHGPHSGEDAEGKQKMTDKIKDKLPFGKK